jgi:hypothetical protein
LPLLASVNTIYTFKLTSTQTSLLFLCNLILKEISVKQEVFTGSIVLCLVLSLCASCCARTYTTEEGTPSYTVETLIIAYETQDIDMYLSVLPAKMRTAAEASRAMMGDMFEDTMKKQLSQWGLQVKGASVTDEKVEGDKATVTLSNEAGKTVNVPCIKESDGWKIDVGK